MGTAFSRARLHSLAGFTLVETLVAITILTIAIVGPFQAIQTALISSRTSRDTLIAASLTQESIEYVRSVRDANYAYNASHVGSEGSWLFGLDGSTRGGVASSNCLTNLCTLDTNPTYTLPSQVVATCAYPCTSKLYTTATGRYTQQSSGNTASRFTRTVGLTTVNTHESMITSTTTWVTNGITHTTVLSDYLQNWL